MRFHAAVLGFALAAAACGTTSSTPPAANAGPAPVSTRVTDTFTTARGSVALTPIHHATLLLEIGGKAVYFDPTTKGNYEGLPKADYVFVTDIHEDHMDPAGLELVRKPGTVVVAPVAVQNALGAAVTQTMNNGERRPFDGFAVEAVPMYNLVRGPEAGKLFHDKGRGNGYVLDVDGTRFYVSGDTECTDEMKALSRIDVAFLCMNLPYTMPPSEAAACAQAFRPKVLIPFHYGESNLDELSSALGSSSSIEVRKRGWY